ncbi:Cysteine and histidine-rich domain-containing protein 1 [Hypsibius exemplaris]|uniref:Cysteine and histidine-rich domain-containing protein 1 n=1 Tax=Hypsibius exemplaris TaxID=2072580 RepID=A0A1W0X7T4_HYPEX|nr:Cysteine and histidine-rich domain-containing protein 1 [Hypsibius exemplaris]
MSASKSVHCYNKGCGKEFVPSENNAKACVHHPGEPYFHDAYKEWTCCKKRSVDFTEFLNYKGCATSAHNPEKPPEKEKRKPVEDVVEEVAVNKPREALVRPDSSAPLVPLKPEVTASLRKALDEQLGKLTLAGGSGAGNGKEEVKVGDACQQRGCGKLFSGPESDLEDCVHHSGFPVFHEGMKYWSCCQRKTSDFDQWLQQAGCEHGAHVWRKSEEEIKQVPTCRNDFFQTGSHVHVNFYAKNALPEKSVVKVNSVKLHVRLVFDAGQSVFEKEMELGGIIDVEQSQVTMAGPKVEVKLKKAEPVAWKSLELTPPSS